MFLPFVLLSASYHSTLWSGSRNRKTRYFLSLFRVHNVRNRANVEWLLDFYVVLVLQFYCYYLKIEFSSVRFFLVCYILGFKIYTHFFYSFLINARNFTAVDSDHHQLLTIKCIISMHILSRERERGTPCMGHELFFSQLCKDDNS